MFFSCVVGNKDNDDNEDKHVDIDDMVQKEVGSVIKCLRR